jgi:hypothetical protein
MNLGEAFAGTYAQARQNFLRAAAEAGLPVEAKPHPEPGLQGEPLAMDVVRDGHPNAARLLVLTSACHGVEGFCGSGVQVAALRDADLRQRAQEAGVALLYIHALNPYGFSHLGRATHENVDLNRNFHDFTQPLPVNEAYRELHELLVPASWPPSEENQRAVGRYVAERGIAHYQAVVSRGQYEYPDGLFYGGRAPCWSNLALREAPARPWPARGPHRLDRHPHGPGPQRRGRAHPRRPRRRGVHRARHELVVGRGPHAGHVDLRRQLELRLPHGPDVRRGVRGVPAGRVHRHGAGVRHGAGAGDLPGAARGAVAAPPPGGAGAAGRGDPQQVFEAFYTDTDAWRTQVWGQAREALLQAVAGLSA